MVADQQFADAIAIEIDQPQVAALLVAASLVPAAFGLGTIYFVAALAGGLFFLLQCKTLVLQPGRETARAAFRASLVQLSAVLFGAIADVALRA